MIASLNYLSKMIRNFQLPFVAKWRCWLFRRFLQLQNSISYHQTNFSFSKCDDSFPPELAAYYSSSNRSEVALVRELNGNELNGMKFDLIWLGLVFLI